MCTCTNARREEYKKPCMPRVWVFTQTTCVVIIWRTGVYPTKLFDSVLDQMNHEAPKGLKSTFPLHKPMTLDCSGKK